MQDGFFLQVEGKVCVAVPVPPYCCLCATACTPGKFKAALNWFCTVYSFHIMRCNMLGAWRAQWVERGDVEVDIGGNPSAEGGDDEAVDSSSKKVVDIIDAFRLAVGTPHRLQPY